MASKRGQFAWQTCHLGNGYFLRPFRFPIDRWTKGYVWFNGVRHRLISRKWGHHKTELAAYEYMMQVKQQVLSDVCGKAALLSNSRDVLSAITPDKAMRSTYWRTKVKI